MKKVLFMTEKWCDANPQMGLTNHYHNLFGSLTSTGLAEVNFVHYDEVMFNSGTHFDLHARKVLDEYSPEIVVVSHMGQSYLNPSIKTYKEIKKRGLKLVFIWPDTREWIPEAIKSLDLADLHVSWACEKDDDEPVCLNHVWMWTPEDPTLYFNDTKTSDVSFIGSLNGYQGIRLGYINYLKGNGIPVVVSGGQRENKLGPEDYAKQIRTSKMNINFSESAYPGIHQCKGRVFESMASNSLLLESQNPATRRRAIPGLHYVEFGTPDDLRQKIIHFLQNEEERQTIAKKGYDLFHEKYSPAIYWSTIFNRI